MTNYLVQSVPTIKGMEQVVKITRIDEPAGTLAEDKVG